MRLKVISSDSSGNCYLLQAAAGKTLIIECGVRFDKIKKALDFNLSAVVGCLVSHEHGNHCRGAKELTRAGINIAASEGTCFELINTFGVQPFRLTPVAHRAVFWMGHFKIMPFRIEHDTAEPFGFLIDHQESGPILFLTDSVYSPYRFPGLNQVIVEANYDEDILQERRESGATIEMLRDRVIGSHLSFQNTKALLMANDLSGVRNIVLIHLSSAHSHAERFKRETEELTGRQVTIADKGVEVNFDKSPF